MRSELTDLALQLHHETERAILVSDTGDAEDAVWLAKSLVDFSPVRGGVVEVTLPAWLATEKGLV